MCLLHLSLYFNYIKYDFQYLDKNSHKSPCSKANFLI